MKLTKFEIEKLDTREMSTIKAGTDKSICTTGRSHCPSGDKCNIRTDKCS